MTGPPDDPGVIPRLGAELFERAAALAADPERGKSVTVSVSMLEIYNEKVADLLISRPDVPPSSAASAELSKSSSASSLQSTPQPAPVASRTRGAAARGTPSSASPRGAPRDPSRDLQIKEDPSPGGRGVFVDGLSVWSVESADDVVRMIEAGQSHRATGRTNMNEHSSRSHSVVTLKVTTCDLGDAERLSETVAKLHLVDLAGSERSGKAGTRGEQLREGASINTSLSVLGAVINALTDHKGRRGHVPYRESKLTRLLQDSLGGNSVTAMILNISPAASSADESLSALRFAERAKKIENAVSVNRDPKAAKANELRDENRQLLERLERREAHIAALEEFY
jgi:hypothetical protein